MKRLLLFLVCSTFSLNCFRLPWTAAPQPKAPTQKVLTIKIYDPINLEDITKELFAATKQQEVVGVLIMVNSGGGGAGTFSVVHDMIKKLAATKPTICLVFGGAYSGGYLVASAADFIFAHSVSGIGSIGAYQSFDRFKNTRVKDKGNGVEADFTTEFFKAGEFKALENAYAHELTDAQRCFIEAHVAKTYDTFLTMVANNRHLNKDNAKEWADGKCFEAAEALKLGLIDEIGTVFDAEEKMKQLVKKRNPLAESVEDIEFVYE